MAEDYMAQFKMLAGWTSFNDEALEDAYIWGLPNSILQKFFTQVILPKGLDAWKMVIWNLDCLHWGLMELKCSTSQTNPPIRRMSQAAGHTKPQVATTTGQSTPIMVNPQTSDSITLMDVDLQKSQLETHKCYNCQKIRHLTHNCPEPRKQCAWNDISEVDILDLIVKAINAAPDMQEKKKKRWRKRLRWIFDPVGGERHTPFDQSFLSPGKLYGRVYQRYVKLECATNDWGSCVKIWDVQTSWYMVTLESWHKTQHSCTFHYIKIPHYRITHNPSHWVMSLIRRCVMSWWDAWGLEEQCSCCGRKSFYCSKHVLLNDDDDDDDEAFGEYIECTK